MSSFGVRGNYVVIQIIPRLNKEFGLYLTKFYMFELPFVYLPMGHKAINLSCLFEVAQACLG